MRRCGWATALPGILLGLLLLPGCSGGNVPPLPGPAPPPPRPQARAADAPRRALFPPTSSGVHLNLVFNYNVRNPKKEIGVVDVVWGASSPNPRQVFNQFYTPFERDGPYGPTHTLQWWLDHHPDWIEYRCDRTTIAFEFGERANVPLDIANPAFWNYQRIGAVNPALEAGYRGIDFDNLSLDNYSMRCGHHSKSGAWVQQYSRSYSDAAYARDVIAWAHSTYAYIHAYSSTATMAMNYSYQSDFGFDRNYALMTQADEVLDERGFTNWGSKRNVASPQEWSQIVRTIVALQANGSCYMENGEEPGLSRDIAQAERLWVVANYLLTRDDCTYVWMSGFTATGAQDYGTLLLFPEYALPIGAPNGAATAAGDGWERSYRNGLVVVNPSARSIAIPLTGSYVDENGNAYSGSIRLHASTGQILLRHK